MGACASNDAGGAGGAAAAVDGVTVVMTPFEAKLAAHVKQVCEEEKALWAAEERGSRAMSERSAGFQRRVASSCCASHTPRRSPQGRLPPRQGAFERWVLLEPDCGRNQSRTPQGLSRAIPREPWAGPTLRATHHPSDRSPSPRATRHSRKYRPKNVRFEEEKKKEEERKKRDAGCVRDDEATNRNVVVRTYLSFAEGRRKPAACVGSAQV